MAAQFPVWTGLDLLRNAANKIDAESNVHLVGKLPQEDAFQSNEGFIQRGPLEWPAIETLIGKCA